MYIYKVDALKNPVTLILFYRGKNTDTIESLIWYGKTNLCLLGKAFCAFKGGFPWIFFFAK